VFLGYCRTFNIPEKPSFASAPPARQHQGERRCLMYFDRRLWAMMEGLRVRVAAAVGLGLMAMAVGILRFVCLGPVLALTFAGAPLRAIAIAAAATAACVLLRAGLEHARALLAQDTAGR